MLKPVCKEKAVTDVSGSMGSYIVESYFCGLIKCEECVELGNVSLPWAALKIDQTTPLVEECLTCNLSRRGEQILHKKAVPLP